jgi:hypothetical protein
VHKRYHVWILMAGVLAAGAAQAASVGHAAPSVAVPAADIPKVPTANASTLEPPSQLLHFRREANFAQQSQQLEDEISLLKLQSEVSALKKKIRKDEPASALDSAASFQNYVTTIVGFRGQWRADVYLNGHGYWVRPGDRTPLGTVSQISSAGVWIAGPHGKVFLGMREAGSGSTVGPIASFAPPASTNPAVKAVARPTEAQAARPLPKVP